MTPAALLSELARRPRGLRGLDLFAALMRQDEVLVQKGWPPMTGWWKAMLEAFYASGKRRLVARVGRKGTKSATMCRVAVNEALRGAHVLRPGDIGLVPFLSENAPEARARLFTVQAILRALGAAFEPHDGELELTGKHIRFGVRAARVGAVSGPTAICLVADEVAKWKDDATGANPATEVLRSVRPSMATQVNAHEFMLSSPWSTLDAHHDAFSEGDTDEQMVAYAPTWQANPTVSEVRTRELEKDLPTWEREYKAVPMGSAEVHFFDHRMVDAAASTGLVMPVVAKPGAVVTAGGDLAFVRDCAALAFAHRYGAWDSDTSRYLVSELHERKPESGAPLVPGDVIGDFAGKLAANHVEKLMADGHYRMSAVEHLERHGMHFLSAPEGQGGKAESYTRTRVLLHGRRLEIPAHAGLVRQLKEVTSKPTPGGGLSIKSPEKAGGGHGDLLSAVVLALYQPQGYEVPDAGPLAHSKEAWEALVDAEEAAEERLLKRKMLQTEDDEGWDIGA